MPNRPPALEQRPEVDAHALEGAVRALRTGRPEEAERLASQFLRSAPNHARAAQLLGQALLMQARPEDAIGPLQSAAQTGDDPGTDIQLARALAAVGRPDEAHDALRRAAARRPPFPPAFLELAGQLKNAGRIDEGVAVLESGLALTPDSPVLRIGLGYLHLECDERAKARALFSQAHAAAPGRHDALVALASVTQLDGDHTAAADLYRRALDLRPGDAMSRINLGKSLLELGDRETGEESLRAAVRGAPQLAGLAITVLGAASHGRVFLSPDAATAFLGLDGG
jgi:tetratricopeptide (TPR) repeat protein